MPGKPYQSKLLPHLDFIRECRKRRVSYRRIAAELRIQCGLETHHTTILSFYQTYSRLPIIPSVGAPKRAPQQTFGFERVDSLKDDFNPDGFFLTPGNEE